MKLLALTCHCSRIVGFRMGDVSNSICRILRMERQAPNYLFWNSANLYSEWIIVLFVSSRDLIMTLYIYAHMTLHIIYIQYRCTASIQFGRRHYETIIPEPEEAFYSRNKSPWFPWFDLKLNNNFIIRLRSIYSMLISEKYPSRRISRKSRH